MEKTMKTICFKVEDDLYRDFKMRVAGSGLTMQQYMNNLIRENLQSPEDRATDIHAAREELAQLRKRIDEIDQALSETEGRIGAESENI